MARLNKTPSDYVVPKIREENTQWLGDNKHISLYKYFQNSERAT